jgi:hypothetical protein
MEWASRSSGRDSSSRRPFCAKLLRTADRKDQAQGEEAMLRILKVACLAAGCLGFSGVVAHAQEVVHAMTGTIRSIDAAQKSFTLFRDSGSLITFKEATGSKMRIANATSADSFNQKDAYVIVFYYGMIDNPTAVAVHALGTGPFTATVGTITSFDERDRSISVKEESGSVVNYKISADTIAESDFGVVQGYKIRPEKGGHIRVVGAVVNDNPTALFLNLM